MNKDKKWLLHEFRKLTFELQNGYAKVKAIDILPLIDQLDETKKAVVPQFVADWIGKAKKCGYSISDSMEHVGSYFDTNQYDKAMRWAKKNQDKFARAWLDGYVIEKEPLYLAQVKGHSLTDSIYTYWHVVNDLYLLLAGRNEISNGENKLSLEEWSRFGITSENAEFTEVEE